MMDKKMIDRRQEQIDRITVNEARLDRCTAALAILEQALQGYADVQQDLLDLESYYASRTWLSDKDAQEKGTLPADLKCGVLSEDAVFDMLTDNKELCVAMAEFLAALKNR